MNETSLGEAIANLNAPDAPRELYGRITTGIQLRRRARRRVWSGVAVALCSFALLTFVPTNGMAADLQRIIPTLFLKTTLQVAEKTMRTPLMLPAAVPQFGGSTLTLGPDTPSLVGRWASYETVAVTVSEQMTTAGGLVGELNKFDLRRSTYPGMKDPNTFADAPKGAAREPVKVGPYDGVLILMNNHPVELYWASASHTYRLMVSGLSADQLIDVASQIN